MKTKHMGIYLHIPFCKRKCLYCDFLSFTKEDSVIKEYCDALCDRIISCADKCKTNKYKDYIVDTIFIGGGTPSILNEEQISKILKTLYSHFEISENAEISIECNPGTVTHEKLQCYREHKINRISFGLQSANDDELKSIGRIHNFEDFLTSYKLAREVGFTNINIDMMSALPNQTIESYTESLRKVLELNPEHISAYSLILEEGTPMYDIDPNLLPSEDDEREMYYLTDSILKEKGYNRYEISNYSKEGYECAHNISYWIGTDYLGIGLGASSFIDGKRFKEKDCLNAFINRDFGYEDEIILTTKDKMEEFMYLGLRLTKGVDLSDFASKFSEDFDDVYSEVTDKLIKEGLLIREGTNLRLTDKGLDVSNRVMAEFIFE